MPYHAPCHFFDFLLGVGFARSPLFHQSPVVHVDGCSTPSNSGTTRRHIRPFGRFTHTLSLRLWAVARAAIHSVLLRVCGCYAMSGTAIQCWYPADNNHLAERRNSKNKIVQVLLFLLQNQKQQAGLGGRRSALLLAWLLALFTSLVASLLQMPGAESYHPSRVNCVNVQCHTQTLFFVSFDSPATFASWTLFVA